MICNADTVGVFQIESRAQMSMLPRLKPRTFYDLVIEVAIVRPGPIQGGMVHPFLRRRDGREPVVYPSDAVRQVLEKTMGVPIFQEQVMRLAVVAAGFTPGEADQLRRAMAAWRRAGEIDKLTLKLVKGMLDRGYSREFAEQIYKQIQGFGEYGFPESHAASFALLVYASAWLKCYYPAAFCAALLNSQPMGFYTEGQLIRDAIAHGVEVLPIDVCHSEWDCTLEDREQGAGNREQGERREAQPGAGGLRSPAFTPGCSEPSASVPRSPLSDRRSLRLGTRLVRGLRREAAEQVRHWIRESGVLPAARLQHKGARLDSVPCSLFPVPSPISREALLRLAAADAFRSLGLSRREALWRILALEREVPAPPNGDATPSLFAAMELEEPPPALPPIGDDELVAQDYDMTGFSLHAHPLGLLRSELDAMGVVTTRRMRESRARTRVVVAGLVTMRQRPPTAKGVVFVTLEDETGMANLILRPRVFERQRAIVRRAALIAEGTIERQDKVVHLMATRVHDLSARLGALRQTSRDYH